MCATSCFDSNDCAPGLSCSNSGECVTPCDAATCAPYVCRDDTSCEVSCVNDSDCADGNRCHPTTNECVEPTVGNCFDFECAPYACNGFGGCRNFCTDDSYCAAGSYCETDGQYCY